LILQAGDHARLQALVRSASARPSLVQRARIVLMSAEGLTNTEIARRTGATRPTVISAATTLADGGRPPAHLGASHWSSRLLGQQLGISFATVARIWRKWGIQPEHVETFTFSTDLTHQAQVRDLSGLYLNLSQRAAALHRPGPAGLPAAPGQPDPWLKLVEVSLGIITQQAIRRGTFASVRNLIDAMSSLTDGWQDHPESTGHAHPGPNATASVGTRPDRQLTSDTRDDLHRRSSRLVENGAKRDPDRSVGRPRDTKPVRAEFHGARGRRSRPIARVDD
jgi:hypothetical protein